jgi:hypothetical protein
VKIIDRNTLLQQPQGVIFADYRTCDIGHLSVFGGKDGERDFIRVPLSAYYVDLPESADGDWMAYWIDHMEKGAEAKPDFECWGRDGLPDDDGKFVLLDREDVLLLFQRVTKSLQEAYGLELPDVYADWSEEGLTIHIEMLAGLLAKKRHAAGKSNIHLGGADYEPSMSVADLQEIVMTWPTKDHNGDPTEVWVGGTDGLSNVVVGFIPLNARDKEDGTTSADLCLELNVPFNKE